MNKELIKKNKELIMIGCIFISFILLFFINVEEEDTVTPLNTDTENTIEATETTKEIDNFDNEKLSNKDYEDIAKGYIDAKNHLIEYKEDIFLVSFLDVNSTFGKEILDNTKKIKDKLNIVSISFLKILKIEDGIHTVLFELKTDNETQEIELKIDLNSEKTIIINEK
jgi:hypothetical protein